MTYDLGAITGAEVFGLGVAVKAVPSRGDGLVSLSMMADLEGLCARTAAFDGAALTVAGLQLPDRRSVSEWAEGDNIYLDSRTSAEPGWLRLDRTPYLREIVDAFGVAGIQEIDLLMSTQVGKTTAMMCMAGYAADQAPGPALMIQSTEDSVKKLMDQRLVPIFEASPALRSRILPEKWAITKSRIRMDRMDLNAGWAGSPTTLASSAIRHLFFDECDKYPPFSGKEADPIKLGIERTRTYFNRKIVKASTPTTIDGYIWKEYQRSDRRVYLVPCPHCGFEQRLIFPQIKWPSGAVAGDIRGDRLAWYECSSCAGRIEDRHKPRMLDKGGWTSQLGLGVRGLDGAPRHVGYWLNALYSPWLTFSDIAAEFLDCKSDRALLMNFTNSWLAEVWTERDADLTEGRFAAVRRDYPAGTVPAPAVILTAGIDVQKDHAYYIVRAWGPEQQSWLVGWGKVECGPDFGVVDDLEATAAMVVGGDGWPRPDGRKMKVVKALMDRRHRTKSVDKVCRKYRKFLQGSMGAAQAQAHFFVTHAIDKTPQGKPINNGFKYAMLDTIYFKNGVMDFYESDSPGWYVPASVDEEYRQQFLSEQRVVVSRDVSGRPRVAWVPKPGCADNHYWDCECLAYAAYVMQGGERGAVVGAGVGGGTGTGKGWFSGVKRRR